MYLQTEKLNEKRENTMTNTMTSMYQDLYDQAVEGKADYAGELAGMAFAAQEVLRMIALGRIDGVQGQNRIAVLEDSLRKYYQGKGSSSIFARPYAKLEFEAGIERGMKEAV